MAYPRQKLFAAIRMSNQKRNYMIIDVDILQDFMEDIARDCDKCNTKLEIEIKGKNMVKKLCKVCKTCKLRREERTSTTLPGHKGNHGGCDLHNRVCEFGLKCGGYSAVETMCISMNLPIDELWYEQAWYE